ncbi:MAG: hypothetical protein JHC38_07935, partial [Thiotrichales bacterium]|nr:hypothetical protein [Thiotrichales bacterium]
MSKNFFVSDTHFGHAKIIEYGQRPFKNLDEMHQVMIEKWNAVVTAEDTVYHLGDVCFSEEHLPIMDELNGKKNIHGHVHQNSVGGGH